MKSFLLIGQSNMAGRGFSHDVSPIVNEKINMLRNGRWQMMAEPIHFDRPVAGVGLAASFSEVLSEQEPSEKIGLIPCAEGGSSIDEWHPSQTLFQHALSETQFALKTSQLAGILWHQGESDAVEGRFENYYEKLHEVFSAFRKELHAENVPIIVGGLGDFLGKSGFGKHCTKHEHINQALMRVAQDNRNTFYVTAKHLTSNPDGIHMDAQSLRIFGLRYFESFINARSVFEPLSEETEKINHLYKREKTKMEQIYILNLKLAHGEMPYERYEEAIQQFMRES